MLHCKERVIANLSYIPPRDPSLRSRMTRGEDFCKTERFFYKPKKADKDKDKDRDRDRDRDNDNDKDKDKERDKDIIAKPFPFAPLYSVPHAPLKTNIYYVINKEFKLLDRTHKI